MGKFYPLFATIVKCVKGIEECLGKAIPSLKTPLPRSSPCIPDPSALLQEKSGDRSHQGVQSFCHLPDVSQSLFFPAQWGAGRAVPVSSLDLLPVPTCPVPSTLVISQDGSDHVAAAATAILQSRDPPLPAPTHIMAPGPFSIPSSAHHASMGVFASGPLQWETPPSCRPHLSLLCSRPLHWWLRPGNQPTLSSHATGAGSGGGGNWKDTILASNAAQHQVAPVCRKPRTIARHSPCYSEEESSDSSDFNAGSEDRWAAVKRWATKDGSWELADKIAPYTAPVIYKRGGRNPCWKPISYTQLKELCKAAKDYGLGLPYFKNLLQVTLSTLTLVLHDIKNIISCLLSPAE